jgi:hypothetical protein
MNTAKRVAIALAVVALAAMALVHVCMAGYRCIPNTEVCSTTKNALCHGQCNMACSGTQTEYTGQTINLLGDGNCIYMSGFPIQCWIRYPCQNKLYDNFYCRTYQTGTKWCDGGYPTIQCWQCEKSGLGTPDGPYTYICWGCGTPP